MVRVILNATDKYNPYNKAKIERVDYNQSNLFYKYTHDPLEKLIAEDIKVFKEPKTIWQWYGYYITLKARADYKKYELKLAEVYFNTFDTNNVPIMLVLFFQSDKSISRYYSLINIDTEVQNYASKFIDELPIFYDYNKLHSELVSENDRLNHFLTFDLNKRDYGLFYNNRKIYVHNKVTIRPNSNNNSHFFTKYQHIPTHGNKGKYGCIVYNFESPLTRQNGRSVVLKEIQNIKFRTVGVYWSFIIDVPLMFELDYEFNTIDYGENSYYITKKDQHGIYFEKLLSSSREFKDLIKTSKTSVHDSLNDDDDTFLKNLLLKLERTLYKSLYIFFTKMDGKYSYNDITNALTESNIDFGSERIVNKNDNVKVINKTKQKEGQCLSNSPFNVMEYDFSDCIKTIYKDEVVKIKFVLTNTHLVPRDDLVVLDVAKTYIVRPYNGGKFFINISRSSFDNSNYEYYTHSGNNSQKITEGDFIITHNGISVKFKGDFDDNISNNQNIRVYYEKYTKDKFLMIVFLLKDLNSISYLTYMSFLEASLTNSTISLSSLKKFNIHFATGNHLDHNLSNFLNEEFQKVFNLNKNDMVTFDFSYRFNKLHSFYHEKSHFPILVCYKDTIYRPINKDKYFGKWETIDLQRCPCDYETKSAAITEKPSPTLLETLEQIALDLGLMEPKQPIDQRSPAKVHETREEMREKTIEHEMREVVQHEQKRSENASVDISLSGPKDYDFDNIHVSGQNTYSGSNLFCYYTHTPKTGKILTISSIVFVNSPKKIVLVLKQTITFESLDVYFNVRTPDHPVMLVFNAYNGKRYFTVSISSGTYSISEDSSIAFNFTSKLIDESDKNNNTITYQIENTPSSDTKYGFRQSISIKRQNNVGGKGFSIFTHSSTSKSNLAYVLFNKTLLTTRIHNEKPIINDIQNKYYESIRVYCLDFYLNFPIIAEFKQSGSTNVYVRRRDQSGFYWTKDQMNLSDNDKTRIKLDELHYFLGSSVIIEIDKGGGSLESKVSSYPMKMIENTIQLNNSDYVKTRYVDASPMDPKINITLAQPSIVQDSSRKLDSGFKYFKHQIPKQSDLYEGPNIISQVSGIRLFISNSTDIYPSELYLYNKTDKSPVQKDRVYLNYPLVHGKSDDLYVFFYNQDPRPVLLCYNNHAFIRFDNDDTSKWVLEKSVNYSKVNELLPLLNSIHSKMKRKLTFIKTGDEQNINISENSLQGGFKRVKYIASPFHNKNIGPFKLPITSIIKHISDGSVITKLFEELDNKTFDSVNIYFNDAKDFIYLFEFTDELKKTHFQRVDSGTKYWIEERLFYTTDIQLSDHLIKIKSQIDSTLIYEIDNIVDGYNTNIKLSTTPNYPETGFTKYTHSPKNITPKTSVILYKNNKLMKKHNKVLVPINEIENQQYHQVTVYFGSKSKHGAQGSILIVGLIKKTQDDTTTIYFRYKKDQTLSLSHWEQVNIPSPDLFNNVLIYKLKDTELDLMESVVVLLDKSKHNLNYGEPEIKEAVNNLNQKKVINIQKMDSICMKVKDKTHESQGRCLNGTGYKVFEHYIKPCVGSASICGLRFFIPSSNGHNYDDITLYNNLNNIDTIYFAKHDSLDKVYVYFYGGVGFENYREHIEGDPRPLLIYYGTNAYRPKKIENAYLTEQVGVDFSKWTKVPEISDCIFDLNLKSTKSSTNEPLLNTLVETSGYLNPVELNPRKIIGLLGFIQASITKPTTATYTLHNYSVNVSIKIEISSDNLKCYRKYTYHPIEMTNVGSSHRLGSLLYTDNRGTSHAIDYSDSDFKYYSLMEVSVFYYVYDVEHNFPLFIMLCFKDFDFKSYLECYQLTSRPGLKDKPWATLKWEKIKRDGDDKGFLNDLWVLYHDPEFTEEFITDIGKPGHLYPQMHLEKPVQNTSNEVDDLIEQKLYYIRSNLNIEFSEEQKQRPLFDPKNCYEDSNTGTIIKATSGTFGTLATVGTGVGVTAATRPEWFIPVIRALV